MTRKLSCQGKRVCTEQGLTDCDAASPMAEECNGIDDDCDGDLDEPTLENGESVDICNDENPCTEDHCSGVDGCVNALLDAAECDDGNACTLADTCVAGACHGQPLLCDDDDPCTDDACHVDGWCQFVANTGSCDDGNPCTVADQCLAGQCLGTSVACDCQGDGDCAPLEDGDMCNGTLVCDFEVFPYRCKVDADTVVECPQPDGPDAFCLASQCGPLTGECQLVPNHSGFSCDDGDACTMSESCQDGICTGGVPVNCNDGNGCTNETCDAAIGCVHEPNGEACDDGDLCTTGDQCQKGQCAAGGIADCDDGNPCTKDGCQLVEGCVYEPTDSLCNDGDACTIGDHCLDMLCVYVGLLECDDKNECTDDSCVNPGGCVNLPNDGGCDDGNFCTLTDTCVNGECVGSNEQACQDDNPCTVDSCSPQGCQYLFQGACTVQPGPGEGKDHVIGSVYNIDPNGTMGHIRTGGWGDNYWALLQFPLDGMPPTATKATIRLFGMNDNNNPTSMYFDRVTSAWAENCTWSQKPSTVNITSIPASQVGVWYEIDVTDLYNGWRAGDYPNHGVQFRSHGTSNNYNGFWSSDYAVDPSLRPLLVVEPTE
jgi:hypothetical protein